MQLTREEKLFGTTEPVASARGLTAGPLSAELEDGQLRNVRFQGVEAIRGISFLVRNENWGTYPAQLTNLSVVEGDETFTITYEARCGDDQRTLAYQARIEGTHNRLRFEATAVPSADFTTNRTGFVVLHPLEGVAGAAVEVEHSDGRREQTQLPEAIAPAQPLFDLRAMTHQVLPGVRVRCLMEADVPFEMEDQRNWTDASFKTYVRPLALPRPYVLTAGISIRQAVTLSFDGLEPSRRAGGQRTSAVALRLGEVRGRLPALGLGLPADQIARATRVLPVLARLRPAWLVAQPGDLAAAGTIAAATGARLALELAVRDEQHLAALAEELKAAHVTPAAITVSPEADLKSVPAELAAQQAAALAPLYQRARELFPGVQLGGGSLAYFTELNRKRPPQGLLDFVSHTTCPIVHAADDRSVMETLEALPWVARSVRTFAGRAGYRVGPVALGMRQNPYGSGPAETEGRSRVSMARIDPRQRGLFGAAFYAGYAAAMAPEGIDVLTFCAPTGPDGLVVEDPELHVVPAYHVLRVLARAGGRDQVLVASSDGSRVRALGFRDPLGTYVLATNLTADELELSLGFEPAAITLLDEPAFERAAHDLNAFAAAELPVAPGSTRLRLGAYAVALLRVS